MRLLSCVQTVRRFFESNRTVVHRGAKIGSLGEPMRAHGPHIHASNPRLAY